MSHGVNLAPPRPNEYMPDPRRPALTDIQIRNLYFRGTESTSHSTLTVGNEQTFLAGETMRVRSVQVAGVTGGTVTVQVSVDGVPLFEDAHRPVSDAGVKEPSAIFNFPPGSVITTSIAASTGVPAGAANVVIDTEPFVLVPKAEEIQLKGKDRLFPSRRRAANLFNEFGTQAGDSVTRRAAGGIGSGGTTGGETEGGTIPGAPGGPGDVDPVPPIIKPGPIKPPKSGPLGPIK